MRASRSAGKADQGIVKMPTLAFRSARPTKTDPEMDNASSALLENYSGPLMSLTDREKEQLKAMIDAGEPMPPRYRAVLFAEPHEAELIWPGKRAEATDALRESERRFRLVVEAAPNAMVMISRTGQIVMVNAQAERVFGYSRAELVGQPVEMLVPERFRGHHPGLRAEYLADPQPRPMGAGRDLYGLKKDGSEFPVEIGLNRSRPAEGRWCCRRLSTSPSAKRRSWRCA